MKQLLASSLLGEETKYILSFWFNSYKDWYCLELTKIIISCYEIIIESSSTIPFCNFVYFKMPNTLDI